jgi:hypothetical protein
MIEIVALLLYLGNPAELKEHTLMSDFGKCLEKKRIASRNSNNAVYQCVKVMATVKDGKIINIASK